MMAALHHHPQAVVGNGMLPSSTPAMYVCALKLVPSSSFNLNLTSSQPSTSLKIRTKMQGLLHSLQRVAIMYDNQLGED